MNLLEAVLVVDGRPDAGGRVAPVAGEAFRVQQQVHELHVRRRLVVDIAEVVLRVVVRRPAVQSLLAGRAVTGRHNQVNQRAENLPQAGQVIIQARCEEHHLKQNIEGLVRNSDSDPIVLMSKILPQ